MKKKALAILLALVMMLSLLPMGALAASNSSVPLTLVVSSYSAPFLNGAGVHNQSSYTASKYIKLSDVGSDNASGIATARFVGSNETGWTLVIDVEVGDYKETWTTNARVTNKDMSAATGYVTFALSFNSSGGVRTYIHISGATDLPVKQKDITLSYDGNDETGCTVTNVPASETKTVDEGKSATFTVGAAPTCGCGSHQFKEWNTEADGTGTAYAAGGSITISTSTTLYAIWEDKETPPTPPIPDDADWSKLTVEKTSNKTGTVEPGDEIIYTITVSNDTGVTLKDIKVSDKLPTGLTFVSYTATAGAYDKDTGIWTIPELADGDEAVLMIVATVADDATGTITNTAEITDAANKDKDGDKLPTGGGDDDSTDVEVEKPAAAVLDLNGLFEKDLTVTGTMAPEKFTILVQYADTTPATGKTTAMDKTGKADFTFAEPLTFENEGTYTYSVLEYDNGTDATEGMDYSDARYTMTVTVEKVEKKLVASVSISGVDLENGEKAVFENVYTEPEQEKYAVTYTDGVDGAAFADETHSDIAAGAAIPDYSKTPTREGYTFDGWLWYDNDGNQIDKPDVMPAYNLTAKAQWKSNEGKYVDFDLDDIDGNGAAAIYKDLSVRRGSDALPRRFAASFEAKLFPLTDNAAATMGAFYRGTAYVTRNDRTDVPFEFADGTLRFTEAGTYVYTVKETVPTVWDRVSNVSYDNTTYTLTIVVAEDTESGELYVDQYYTGSTAPSNGISTPVVITNTYYKRSSSDKDDSSGSSSIKPTLNKGSHDAYVMGYPDGTVRPNGSITRAEASAILFRLLSDDTRDEYFTTSSSFTDVNAGAWYNNSVATLEKAGIIVDTAEGGEFRPDEAITRAELAAMLAQFADAKPVASGIRFSDVPDDHWAYDAIYIAAKMGWIVGYPDGTFDPDATITRAEMMTLINRALDRVPSDEDHLLSERTMLTFSDCKPGAWYYIAVQEATNSHTYERSATEKNGDEQWVSLRDNIDWTKYEY